MARTVEVLKRTERTSSARPDRAEVVTGDPDPVPDREPADRRRHTHDVADVVIVDVLPPDGRTWSESESHGVDDPPYHDHRAMITGMDDDHPIFQRPNGPAYSRDESRHGLPLNYVGEKIRNALEETHQVVREADEQFGPPDGTAGKDLSRHARAAFGYQLTAFLALYNMLGSRGDHKTDARMLAMGFEEFERWLDFVEREGSTSGA